MRTLATQVKLRRLIRAYGDAVGRLRSDPYERQMAGSVVDRLLELSGELRQAWGRERDVQPLEAALDGYVNDAMRSIDFAIAGLQQVGADLGLLNQDFDAAALPLEVFLRGLDAEPALQRSA